MATIPMIDTLTAFLDIRDYEDSTKQFLKILDEKKKRAKMHQADNDNEVEYIVIGDMTFEVLPNGKEGYAYILHNELYEIDFAQYRSKNKDFYPVFIKVKSQALWSMSPEYAWSYAYRWIGEHVGDIIADRISRIDLCCHTDGFYIDMHEAGDFKGQFYIDNTYRYRRQVSAIYFGSSGTGKVYGRIYDKVLELTQKKQKTWFYEVWKRARLDSSHVWNIEFQINREYLKEYSINTVQEAFDRLATIWDYCTTYWLVKIVPDNPNISRCSVDDRWKPIQEAFKGYRNKPLIERDKQLSDDADAMIPSLYGTFTSFAAKKGISDVQLAMQVLHMNGNKYLKSKDEDFKSVVTKKKSLLDRKPAIEGTPVSESVIMVGDKTVFDVYAGDEKEVR